VSLSLGCAPEEPDAGERLFTEKVQPLFEEKCGPGCHEPGGYNGALFLGEDYGSNTVVNASSTQVAMDLISPGSPEDSYLWHKLMDTHKDVGGSGEPMPYAEWPLPDEELDLIREYIEVLGE
jgi:hypothetical protein